MSQKAKRAAELNRAISGLWLAAGIHNKHDFNEQCVPIYTALLNTLKKHQPPAVAEQHLIDLIHDTTHACQRRWAHRLPLNRPGSDYRRYEIIYTEALITAMAVDGLKQTIDQPPEPLAQHLIPRDILKRLQADPMVWEDWLGFFRHAKQGGLHQIATGNLPGKKTTRATARNNTPEVVDKAPPPGSGKAMLRAIATSLQNGSLSYNQSGDFIHVDRAGRTFLEHPKTLKWCREQLQLDDDIKKLKSRFSRLKVLNRSPQGRQLFYGRAGAQGHRRVGYVINNPASLWQAPTPTGSFEIESRN